MSEKKASVSKDNAKSRLLKMGLLKPWDFLLHFPYRFEDRTHPSLISEVTDRTLKVMIQGTVGRVTDRGRVLTAQLIDPEENSLTMLWFGKCPYRFLLTPGNQVCAFGAIKAGNRGLPEMSHPILTALDKTEFPKTLTPVYPLTAGLKQWYMARQVQKALDTMASDDPLPSEIKETLGLMDFKQAIGDLHHPAPDLDVEAFNLKQTEPWRRIKFDEILSRQIMLKIASASRAKFLSHALKTDLFSAGDDTALTQAFLSTLPFTPTASQLKVRSEIIADLMKTYPMMRLVQGDVGSGKTLVAALAALLVIESGHQAALMVPTEILARQHFKKFKAWFEPLGLKCALMVGSLKAKEKREIIEELKSGQIHFAVGTHALISEGVSFKDLTLAIVDEQHRFGVNQRARLRMINEDGMLPHLLMMTATPIPRTLAMTGFAGIEVSTIDELPAGRKPITTVMIDESRLGEVLSGLERIFSQGAQAYWICPRKEDLEGESSFSQVIYDDEGLPLEATDERVLISVAERAAVIRSIYPAFKIACVHGDTPADEKEQIMGDFAAGRIDLLIATTVIEVGVDVPNASVIVIEGADCFGLSQLHQLRGRVGRGSLQSSCVLMYKEPLSEKARERLMVVRNTTDGFKLALEDLRLRGAGDFLGTSQSGGAPLRFASLVYDLELIKTANAVAEKWIKQDEKAAMAFALKWRSKEGMELFNA